MGDVVRVGRVTLPPTAPADPPASLTPEEEYEELLKLAQSPLDLGDTPDS